MMKNRNSNIELLRIISMLFIIMHHCLINGYGLQNGLLGNSRVASDDLLFMSVINAFIIIGVNVFFLISGYYGISFSINKIVKLLVELYIYNTVFYFLAFAFHIEEFNFTTIKCLILPIYKYWFIYVYILLTILSPLINIGLSSLSRYITLSYLTFFTILFCIIGFCLNSKLLGLNSGYSIIFAVYLYFCGYSMKKYNILNFSKLKQILLWALSTLGTISMACFTIIKCKYGLAWKFFSYNNIFIVISSVCFVYIFIHQGEKYSPRINAIAKHILPVYYIHTSSFFAFYRNKPLMLVFNTYEKIECALFLFLYTFAIFILCVLIDKVRHIILDSFQSKIETIIIKRFNKANII